MKGFARHKFVHEILKWFAIPFFKLKFGFSRQKTYDIKTPFILFANHNTNYDPLMISIGFKQIIYYVASEHIFRWGFLSKLIVWLVSPIPKQKGNTDIGAVRDIIGRLRAGANVGIFPEGNCSFDGVTCPIIPASGKLVKLSGATLVTYLLEGGYFTEPRWGRGIRKGRMRGYIVNTYSPSQLKSMSADEINRVIEKDLYEDAYARQEKERIVFKGKKTAEELETTLFTCPLCKKIGTLKSEGERFFCECGLHVTYTSSCFLEGNAPFATIRDWNVWQHENLKEHLAVLGDKPAFSDTDVKLFRLEGGHTSILDGQGSLAMYKDRLVCADKSFMISDIQDFALYGQKTIVFTLNDTSYYEIKFDAPVSGYKYVVLYQMITGRASVL